VKVIKSDKILPFDVDLTLIKPPTPGRHDDLILMYGGRECRFSRIQAHIDLMIHHKVDRGFTIIVWSANGHMWAEKVVKALGLEQYVDYVLTKPLEYVDDKNVGEWMSSRIYLD
jgi:predicted phosphatase